VLSKKSLKYFFGHKLDHVGRKERLSNSKILLGFITKVLGQVNCNPSILGIRYGQLADETYQRIPHQKDPSLFS
jgi:hypothetical protein